MIIRQLSVDDIASYKKLRLQLLQDEPESFGSAYEEEALFDDSMWINRLSKSTVKVFGAFESSMVGIAVMVLNPRKKMNHIASLHSMYVLPENRKQGIARQLIETIVTEAKKHSIKRLNLSVVSSNQPAVRLYRSLGFEEYGLEPETIHHNGYYYDLLLLSRKVY